jgi:membrane protein DedA with SNARE-associated domain
MYQEYGTWIILIKGVTPIPYKIVTIASGLAGYDLLWFVLLSVVTRGARFFLVAGFLNHFGDGLRHVIERNLGLVAGTIAFFIIAGFVVAKYLV